MVQYRAIKEQHHKDVCDYIAWGIKGYRSSGGVSETAFVYIPDIFLSERDAVDFASLCTKMELSPIHLADVVDDYLGT